MAVGTRAQRRKEEEKNALENAKRNETARDTNHNRPSSQSPVPEEADQIHYWHGILLPQFDIPRWRKRAGVPTVVLERILFSVRFIPRNRSDHRSEDVHTDSQGEESFSEDSDAPASESSGDGPTVSNGPHVREGRHQKSPNRNDRHQDSSEEEARIQAPRDKEDDELYNSFDVSSLEVEGLSNDENVNDWDIEKWGHSLTKFVRSPFGPEGFLGGGWQGVKPLGRGGFAMAALWERRNEDAGTIDKMVIKQIGKRKVKTKGPFAKVEAWDSRCPLEVDLMRAMKNKPNVIQIRGYRRYLEKEVHRIYMDYCSSGDLYGLIAEYRARRQYMPEAFICHVFLHLARACKSLTEPTFRTTDSEKNQKSGKDEIVHRDIKPRNVFLGDLDNGQDQTGIPYPEVRLGDLGGGFFTREDDDESPTRRWGGGTEGYKSLEMENWDRYDLWDVFEDYPHVERGQRRFNRHDGNLNLRDFPTKMLSWTNIWGVGAVMFDIMTLKPVKNYLWQTRHPNDDEDDEDYDGEIEEANVRDGIRNTPYSRPLHNLVQNCLSDIADYRPTAAALISTLETFIASKKAGWHIQALDNSENTNALAQQQIPFHNFKDLPTGDWESSENQSDYRPPGSSFPHKPSEKQKWDADRPERNKRRAALQAMRNEERENKRKRGDEDVSSDEVWDPSTGERKRVRVQIRRGDQTW
ncbi:MAG: hypothetical protein Q9169_001081 [Polycauliona sp. 2 TL-2023]